MKKRNSLLSLVLAACLCFMLAVPALAAEDNIEIVDDHYLVKTNIDTDKVTLEDNTISYNGENKQIDVNIIASGATKEVSSADVANAYERAMESYKRDMVFDANGNPDGTFDYTLVGEDEIYFYEQTADSPMQAEMDVICLTQEDKAEMKSEYAQRLLNNMPTNISAQAENQSCFAKMYINNTTRNYSSCTITLPESNTVSVDTSPYSALFLYGGFSGGYSSGAYESVEADLGLMYNNPEMDVWKCFMTITSKKTNGKKVTEEGTFLPNRMEATYKNGYLPGQAITIVCMPYNDSTSIDGSDWGTKGSIVLKAYGLAKYGDREGKDTNNTKLTTVKESNTVYFLDNVKTHKWVTSLGDSTVYSGYNVGKFTNISINGNIQPVANMQKDGGGDWDVTKIGPGSVNMTIKR